MHAAPAGTRRAAIVVARVMGMLMVTWAATDRALRRARGATARPTRSARGRRRHAPPATPRRPSGPSVDARAAEQNDGSTGRVTCSSTSSPSLFVVRRRRWRWSARRPALPRAARPARGGARTPGRPIPRTIGFEVIDAPSRLARALSEDAGAAASAARGGLAAQRDRAVLAPVRGAGRGGGLGRKAWETPGGVRAAAARPRSTRTRTRRTGSTLLYREARFSHHELDESARDEALEALVTIHLGLAARTGSLP